MANTNIDTETILNDTLATSNVETSAKTRCRKKRVGKNAARERTRVQQLKMAFTNLQRSLPNVPEDTKLSRLDILLLAINYITHLKKILASTEEIENESSGRQRQEESSVDLQKVRM
ncbi:transcription factor 23-like [Clytia hemisphaerica]|uniref:transcription factor 23-like n=1 Tax=Clytia hemisphaerica TaxID=252671 RepID=UPI0034D60ABE